MTPKPTHPTSANSLDKIRDILFGEEARESQKRFGQLEKRLVREIQGMESRLQREIASVEKGLRADLAALAQSLEEEVEQRALWDEDLVKKLGQASKRTTRLHEASNKSIKSLRQRLQATAKSCKELVTAQCAELSESLEGELDGLRHAAVEREDLAGILQELTGRLRKGTSGS